MIYFIILSILFLFSISERCQNSSQRKYLFFFSFFLLFFLSAFRFDIGMDYSAYRGLYMDSIRPNEEIKEAGFRYIYYFLRNQSIPFSCVIFLFSFFTLKYAFKFIKEYSPFLFFSVLIFFCVGQFYFNSFNAMRQVLAAYIIFAKLVPFMEERKFWPYLLCVVALGFCLHMSVIVLLPLYFFVCRRMSLFFRLIVLAVFVSSSSILVLLIYNSPYAMYLTFEHYSSDVALSVYLLFLVALIIAFAEYLIKTESKREKILFNLNYYAILSIVLVILFENTPLVLFFTRISYFFTPVQIVLLPLVVNRLFSNRSKIVVVNILSVFYVLLCYISLHSNGVANKLIPYRTIF